MGEPSTADAPSRRPFGEGRGWLAAVPFAFAWVVAAAMLNGALAPPHGDAPGFNQPTQQLPPPPPSPPATHHDGLVFDPAELITV
ncbi:MAG: hypothetical protein ACLQVI_40710 [Polyangiaceae bacterium]|jgi:hypothetical protein